MADERERKEQKKEKAEKVDKRKEETKEFAKPERRMQNVVRLGETNLDGSQKVAHALLGITGLSYSMARAISDISDLGHKKVLELSEHELHKLEDIIANPHKYNIPSWLYNRRNDPEKGITTHLTTSQLELTKKNDIDRMKKIKCYKGIRHILGQPVRGQRTRSSFRSGGTVGVQRSKAKPASSGSKDRKR